MSSSAWPQPPQRAGGFGWFLGGCSCSAFGFFAEQVVIGYAVYALTGSSGWVGVSLALYFAPMFVLGLLSGAVADWIDDRGVLIRRTELAMALLLAGFAGVLAWLGPEPTAVLGFSLLSGAIRAMHQTLRGAIAYQLAGAENAVRSLGRLNLGARFGQLVGAACAGWSVHQFGLEAAFVLIAAVHLAGAVAFLGLPALPAGERERRSLGADLRDFVRELRSNRFLAAVVGLTAISEVFGFSFVTALPELAHVRFGVGAEGLGHLHAARAFGGIVAAAAFAVAIGLARRIVPAYVLVLAIYGLGVFALGFAPSFVLAMGMLALIAGLAVACDVFSQTMVQQAVPEAMRGRAMGAWVFAIGAAPLGHLELGLLIGFLGLEGALAVNGVLLLLVAVLAWRGLRRHRARGDHRPRAATSP